MPNDAKLGMAVGLGLVIVVAVVFGRRDATAEAGTPAPRAVTPTAPPRNRGAIPAPRKPSSSPTARTTGRLHVVAEGDTLFSLACHYYGDGDRFMKLYRANRDRLDSPDALPTGTELIIPDVDPDGER